MNLDQYINKYAANAVETTGATVVGAGIGARAAGKVFETKRLKKLKVQEGTIRTSVRKRRAKWIREKRIKRDANISKINTLWGDRVKKYPNEADSAKKAWDYLVGAEKRYADVSGVHQRVYRRDDADATKRGVRRLGKLSKSLSIKPRNKVMAMGAVGGAALGLGLSTLKRGKKKDEPRAIHKHAARDNSPLLKAIEGGSFKPNSGVWDAKTRASIDASLKGSKDSDKKTRDLFLRQYGHNLSMSYPSRFKKYI
jgi:hypothetical protein